MNQEISIFNAVAGTIDAQHRIQYLTVNHLRRRLRQLHRGAGDQDIRALIRSATEAVIDEALTTLDFRRSTRLMWEEGVASGILRLLPAGYHDVTTREFSRTIISKIEAIPGYGRFSVRAVGSTRYGVPGSRSKEADEGLQCPTRQLSDWPNVVLEVGYSESIQRLRCDARWWLVNSQGATKLVIVIRVTRHPNTLHIELWSIQQNPNRRTRSNIPFATSEIDIDALGNVTPPLATITIPHATLFDVPPANPQDVIVTAADLSAVATWIFQSF